MTSPQHIAAKLNSGLAPLVSIRQRPTLLRRRFKSKAPPKGRIFRIGDLHRKPLTENVLLRNQRGYVNSQLNTVAHAPSLYHWLFHRCGVPFAETQSLIRSGSLRVGGKTVETLEEAEEQQGWLDWQQTTVELRPSHPTPSTSSKDGFVPALKRALHRRYLFQYFHPGISASSDLADPKSFVHRLSSSFTTEAALGLNVLRPIGFMNSMRGLGIVSNDVSIIRYWNNESLGNGGVYDVRFAAGTPQEVKDDALQRVEAALLEVQRQLPTCLAESSSAPPAIPCSVAMVGVPPAQRDTVGPLMPTMALDKEHRLLVNTPLFPYRVAKALQRVGAKVTLLRSGPFHLPKDLQRTGHRELTPQELIILFAFERKLKLNRVVLSLSEFEEEEEVGGVGQ